MAKFIADAALDAALAYVTAADVEYLCSAQPATFAGIAAVSLGSATPSWSGPADGDISGRKVTFAARTGVAVTATGNVTHVVFARTADSTLRYVTTCSSQAVTSGGTATIAAGTIEIADVT